MAIDACRIKRCDNLYSGYETLIRFINYLRRHWLEQKVHWKLIVLYFYDFRRRIVDAINNCYRILFPYAIRRSQWPWQDWAYAYTDPGHRCLMILAIDFSQYLAPTPKKSPWEHDGIACYMYVLHYLHYVVSSLAFIAYWNIWLKVLSGWIQHVVANSLIQRHKLFA